MRTPRVQQIAFQRFRRTEDAAAAGLILRRTWEISAVSRRFSRNLKSVRVYHNVSRPNAGAGARQRRNGFRRYATLGV